MTEQIRSAPRPIKSEKGGEWLQKSTGIVRRVDNLGRLVLPFELRQNLGIAPQTQMEIYTQGEQIILRKYQSHCIFCGSGGDLVALHGKVVCLSCQARLSQART